MTPIKTYYNHFKAVIRSLQRCIFALWYRGTKVICENCGWRGKKFLKGKCPKCKSLPRTRLIPFSIDYFQLTNNKKSVLHVAPNKNEYLGVKNKMQQTRRYDRLDIRPVAHVNLVEDLTATKLKSDTYDLCVIWHVFEHIPDDHKAIAEVYRLLKPGGHLLMSVPIYPKNNPKTFEDKHIPYEDFERVHGHYDHCRSCGLDYYKRFETVGFKTKTLAVKNLDTSIIETYGLSTGHWVWCFLK